MISHMLVKLPVLLVLLLALTIETGELLPPMPVESATTLPSYTITDLGTLTDTSTHSCPSCSWARGINNAGQVVGHAIAPAGKSHAFLWENGVMQDLGALASNCSGGCSSLASDINDSSQVVGYSSTALSGAIFHGFLWENGVMTDIGVLHQGFNQSFASGINDLAQVVGNSIAATAYPHAVLWENGVITDLGTFGGQNRSWAVDINDSGQIVGTADTDPGAGRLAFLWNGGAGTNLGTLGGNNARALGINNRTQIVGVADTSGGDAHGFLWRDGVMRDLETLGGLSSAANAVNDAGQVVGSSDTPDGDSHAFLWEEGTMYDLNDTIPAGTGWVLESAEDINEVGEIVGWGTIQGATHGFLLTPAQKDLAYYGLGDSVASGHGLQGDPGAGCRRSPGAYPVITGEMLTDLDQYQNVTTIHLACSGATSAGLGAQVAAALADLSTRRQQTPTDALVSITIGANDFGWSNLGALGQNLCNTPEGFLAWVNTISGAAKANIQNAVQSLLNAGDAYIVLTDYHNPFNTKSHILRPFLFIEACRQQQYSIETLYARTEFAVQSLNTAIGQARHGFGRADVRLASVHRSFHRRESPRWICGAAPPELTGTWVQTADCFHPNSNGAEAFVVVVHGVAGQLLPSDASLP